MIIGTGIDITEIERITDMLERHGVTIWKRILAPEEREMFDNPRRRAEYLAGRWAAKEAASKAFGTGIGKVGLHELIITKTELGAPQLTLRGHAAELAEQLGVTSTHVSISHSKEYAVAQVILEK
ncbi:holo-ACP synthase [Tumebacillus sp. ITR2]|uniref:Holo-[acyl-carrier-protein] synthase n=1 Tax=Tumebacillus amylolyticus TaxID=2801339 RepID=A0ABS1JGA1_9BACL|nr:holo-ACP synthase [Tumebacillus amylolyticus]MBL0389301.1 holo-ACP synthase [Tumebacillus amylolyticus]